MANYPGNEQNVKIKTFYRSCAQHNHLRKTPYEVLSLGTSDGELEIAYHQLRAYGCDALISMDMGLHSLSA